MNSSANLASCYAIVLAGGSGTRLWPLSRTLLPKQLLTLNDDKTLLCQTMERVGEFFPSQRTVVVTNEENVFEVRSQICSINSALENQAISEPMGRNTLPAIMLGLKRVVMHDPEAIVAVFPSDHLIKDIKAFGCCLEGAVGLMGDYDLVTFGIKPISPETGYGYVRKGRQIAPGAFEVEGFTEKPDIAKANEFLDSGNYFWNSGMFVFCASAFLEAVKQYAPVYSEWWDSTDESDLRLGYGNLPDMSVDYGVIEHMSSLAVIEATFDWDDLGNWEAIYRLGLKDVHGCVKRGDVLALDCENSLIISHGGKLAAVGMKNTILVQTSDATLVCPLSEVQKVKDVVGVLKSEGSQLVETHLTVKRPWGSYTVLEAAIIIRLNVLRFRRQVV